MLALSVYRLRSSCFHNMHGAASPAPVHFLVNINVMGITVTVLHTCPHAHAHTQVIIFCSYLPPTLSLNPTLSSPTTLMMHYFLKSFWIQKSRLIASFFKNYVNIVFWLFVASEKSAIGHFERKF